MVENWWCLQHEAYRFHRPWRSHDLVVNVDHRAWVQRHSLRAVGEGGILPDLMLFRDGDGVVVRWFADKADAAHPYLRFVGDGQASMPFEEVAQGLTDFVVRVLDRIEGMGAPEVEALRRDWAAITTAPPDEREFCIWSARVGLDPYDPDELTDQREDLLRVVGIVPGGRASGRPPRRGDGRCAPHGRTLDRCCPRHCAGIRSCCSKRAGLGPRRAPLRPLTKPATSALERSVGHLGANGGPVADMRAVMRALGWAREPLLTTDSRPTSPLDAILDRSASGAPVVVTYQDGGVESERFRLARSLFFRHFATSPLRHFATSPLRHFATTPGRRLVTAAHTWDQRASRAFAAEFLAPASALATNIREPVSFSDVDKLGHEYRVSPLVIEHQIDQPSAGLADGRMKVGISPPLCRGRRSSTPAVGQQRGQSRNRSAGRQAIEPGKRFGWFGRIVDEQLLFDGRYQPGDALTVRGDIDRRSGPHHPEVRSEPRLQLGGTYLDHDHNLGQYMDNIQGQASGSPVLANPTVLGVCRIGLVSLSNVDNIRPL